MLKTKQGLTFIELLIVIGLIAVLTALVIFFAQPGERMLKARDDQREVHLSAIWLSVEKKIEQDGGRWILSENCDHIPTDAMTIIGSEPYYNLYACLLPEDYLREPLFDPLFGYYNSLDDYNTLYTIWRNPVTGKISMRAGGETRHVFAGEEEPPLRLGLGEECVLNSDCELYHCADDVCCNEACTDICEACHLGIVGTCQPVEAGTDPRGDCGFTDWSCANAYTRERDNLVCDGTVGTEACSFVKETVEEPKALCSQWCHEGQFETNFVDTRDNGEYKTVLIGTQCWMDQNINIGTRINGISDQGTSCDTIQKYCYGDNDANCTSNNPTYPDGGLYQWSQAMCGSVIEGNQGICPEGWRMPTNNDWDQLSSFEGNMAGHRNLEGGFAGRGDYTGFWSSTQYTAETAWYRSLYKNDSNFYKLLFDKKGGFSVRCIWDG